jgi:hypothetical protein
VNCARRDLCGGRSAMSVPTAIAKARQAIDFFALRDDTVSRVDMQRGRCSKRRIYLIVHCR